MSRFMKPTIENAKKTAQLFNARQVVVCAFDYAELYALPGPCRVINVGTHFAKDVIKWNE